MNRLFTRIFFVTALLASAAFSTQAGCPSNAATVIEVCNDAGGNGTIRAYFYNGDPAVSYYLFSLTTGQYVGPEPLGPVTVNTSIPLPAGAKAGVEFGLVPDGNYVIYVNCSPSGNINIGGMGIAVNSANAVVVNPTIDPDCNPATGPGNTDGSIILDLSGGIAPYDITWPTAVTPISSTNNAPAGSHMFANLDGGNYTAEIRDASNCVFTVNMVIPLVTTPNAGDDQTVCGPTANLSANAAAPSEVGTWTGPAGVIFFPNANTRNAVVSNLAVGVNTLTWTITDTNGLCAGVSDQVDITSNASPTVDAGATQNLCTGASALLAGTIGGSATSATWTSSGDGTFDNASSLTATYSPGPGDRSAETVTLTLTTNDPAGPCVAVSDNVIITITAAVSVEAGPDQTLCSDTKAILAGSFGNGASSATWTTSGDGSFNDATSPTAEYTPGPTDIANTSVTLTFTTNDPAGPCLPASDNVIITIHAAPTIEAGPAQTICSGSTVSLSGVRGGSATSSIWTTSGDGTFDNTTSLAAIYTPGTADISNKMVTLTLTTNDPTGPCLSAKDDVVITIDPAATAEAGAIQTICAGDDVTLAGSLGGSATTLIWTTSGDGAFVDNTLPNTKYTPGPTDISTNSVTLTVTTDDPTGPCVSATDNVVITINARATVDAGTDQTICVASTVPLTGIFGGAASGATWTTSGDGTFDNASSPSAVYTPGLADVGAKTVTLTFTTNDPSGPCGPAMDDVIITIDAGATAEAGVAQTICENGSATLAGIAGGAASNGTWTTAGDGTFNDNTLSNAVYTPGTNDILNKTVTLTFTTEDPAGPCLAASDDVIITIDALPVVDAGSAQTICSETTVTLAGSISGSASSAIWTTAGDGNFNDAGLLNAVYTPGPADASSGGVTLTLTTNDPTGPCAATSANVLITINAGATVSAGNDQTICADGTATLSGSFAGAATTATWSTTGDGTFDNNTITNAVYSPGPGDVANKTVTLIFTTDDPSGPCGPVTDDVIITIDAVATSTAGTDQTVCLGSTVSLAGSVGGSGSSGTWTTAGDGTFDDAASLTADYTPGAADLVAGTVVLTLTSDDPSGPCGAATSTMTITFDDPALVEAGNAQIICSSGTATLAGSSVGGTATTGAWSIVTQPTGGDGSLSDGSQTGTPDAVTFTASVAGDYTLRLTTDDPAGSCGPVTDDVVITVSAVATVDAGAAQTICDNGKATLAATFAGTTGVTWTSAGDGSFNNASLPNAEYTPGANDISAQSVILTVTTAGPCASVTDNVTITIKPKPTIDAGSAQIICSSASIVLNATFGGSATGLLWTTSGDGSFDDNTDPNAQYTPGTNDISSGTATLTATATGSCAGTTDDVIITINPAATVEAGNPQTVCKGSSVVLDATLGGSATTIIWTTPGDGTFSDSTNPDAVYTPGSNDLALGSVTLTATTNNPTGPCPAANDNVVITLRPIPGDQVTAGNETWIGYAYDDAGDLSAIDTRINFANAKYRGFIEATDIDNMTAASTYDVNTDAFDINLGLAEVIQGPNVCGTLLEHFSIRYKMDKTLDAGIYRFTIGADDGIRLLIDGVNVIPATAFDYQSYTEYTTEPLCLSGGVHTFEIHYFENAAYSRLNFNYEQVPGVTTNSPVQVCINSASPVLTVSSTDAGVQNFNWYKNGTLVFTGANYTPAASELDMTTAGTVSFQVAGIYACGETPPVDVAVSVLNTATISLSDPTICESGGVVDLKSFATPTPGGGSFVFAGHPKISGDTFDPTGLAGTTVAITVDYSTASCTATQQTLNVTVTNTATTTVPASAVAVCESAGAIDLTALVSATPAGGTFSFGGDQVTGNLFDPSGLSGIEPITVDYSVGGCTAIQATFDIDVSAAATLTTTNANACQNGAMVNLLTLVSATPAGGAYTFSGAGVIGNSFDPSAQSGSINIGVAYDIGGCTGNGTLQITVLAPTDPFCTGINDCFAFTITSDPDVTKRPSCSGQSDGVIALDVSGNTPGIYVMDLLKPSDPDFVAIPASGPSGKYLFSALSPGNYQFRIVDENGNTCTRDFSLPINVTVDAEATGFVDASCFGQANGQAILTILSGGNGVYEYSIDAGISWITFTSPYNVPFNIPDLPPNGDYTLLVRDDAADPCPDIVPVTINNAVPAISATFNLTSASCNGNDGAITDITATGGHGASYTFSIDGGQSFQSAADFNGLAGGAYTLRVRDGAGCESDFAANITFPGFINSAITKSNADCTNDGNSGSISVAINDPGAFQVALTTDQFVAPADTDYVDYASPSVSFTQLPRGQYFVYIRSGSTACPTRSAPIEVFGVYDVSFSLQAHCDNNALSLALVNVTGEPGGENVKVAIFRKMSTDDPVILSEPLPEDGEIFLDYNQHAFLRTPGEYRIQISQPQSEAGCVFFSDMVDVTVAEPLNAFVGPVAESYPDIPSGKLNIVGFSGGVHPYDVKIDLDSASSFSMPYHSTEFEEAGLNSNQQIEMAYTEIPAGRYRVQVKDANGCVLGLTARVPLDEDLFIPNVFTPNGDGSNDIFFVRNLPMEAGKNQLVVTNRWGKEVFAADDYKNNWDGTGAADGIYFYRLQIQGTDALTGWVEIIRGPKP